LTLKQGEGFHGDIKPEKGDDAMMRGQRSDPSWVRVLSRMDSGENVGRASCLEVNGEDEVKEGEL